MIIIAATPTISNSEEDYSIKGTLKLLLLYNLIIEKESKKYFLFLLNIKGTQYSISALSHQAAYNVIAD